jgi:hypothetical protein
MGVYGVRRVDCEKLVTVCEPVLHLWPMADGACIRIRHLFSIWTQGPPMLTEEAATP